MNKDHRTDLSHILQHYLGLDASAAADAEMLDISPTELTVRAGPDGAVHVVPLEPPLAWGDRRVRLVDMTLAARAALGIEVESAHPPEPAAGIVVRSYAPPATTLDISVMAAVLLYGACFALVRTGMVHPGSLVGRIVETVRFPGGIPSFKWLVNAIALPVLAIHLAEAWYLDRTRLQKFGVKRGSALWWMWMTSCFIEGRGAFGRFGALVREAKAKAK
jgi:hypothetical protein